MTYFYLLSALGFLTVFVAMAIKHGLAKFFLFIVGWIVAANCAFMAFMEGLRPSYLLEIVFLCSGVTLAGRLRDGRWLWQKRGI